MKYEEVSRYEDKKFKRVVGVNRMTFKVMIVSEKAYAGTVNKTERGGYASDSNGILV